MSADDLTELVGTASAAQARKTAPTITYHVLRQTNPGEWTTLGASAARDAKHAIRQMVEARDPVEASGTYVAIPSRSWQPVEIKVTPVSSVKIEVV